MAFKLWLKNLKWHDVQNVLGVIFGAVIVGVSINALIIPNKIADGGVTGIAIILHYMFDWPVSWIVLGLNIPMFLVGWKMVGRKFLFLSIIGVLILSLTLSLSSHVEIEIHDVLLAAIFGGGLSGIGMGIIFRSQGSLGGTDILAVLFSRKTSFSVGQILMGIDAIIFIFTAVIFTPEMAMYAMIYMFIATKMVDWVQEGMSHSKAVIVISNSYQEIADAIMSTLERGVTLFYAKGAYSGEDKQVVYCVVSRAELSHIKSIVHKLDPRAFLSISEVPEVVGEGFSKWRGH